MGRLKDKQLFELLNRYFTEYLPEYRSASEHTLKAYRAGVNAFLEFLKKKHDLALFDISFSMITTESLSEYLMYLKSIGNSDSTCRNRLACLKAFLKYCSDIDSTLAFYYMATDTVAVKREPVCVKIDYLSEKAIRLLIDQPDRTTLKGQRDMFFMILLYDTGARVDELLSARIRDLQTESPAKIRLTGKGRKTRTVPLSLKTVSHFKRYLSKFHPEATIYSDEYIFYTNRGGKYQKMSHDTVLAFMRAYGLAARKYCPEIPENVHPHLFRHSRAMHLYQGGMDLTLVSQWLGHANLQTTLIYAHADTEQKRKAIELATSCESPSRKNPSAKSYTVSDEDTLRKLYGLK